MNKSLITVMLLVAIMISFDKGRAQEVDPEEYFLRGKKLIEANCGDCMGGTQQGLNEGISELLKSIVYGYKNKVEAYKLLADAYNTVAPVYYSTNLLVPFRITPSTINP